MPSHHNGPVNFDVRPQKLTTANPSRFNSEEQKILALLDAEPPSHYKNCFRSALNHLSKAFLISATDPEMAIFRAITAEEEAASGLMQSLTQHKYPDSDGLKPHDHVQKHAVTPFIQAILSHLSFLRFSDIHDLRLAIKNVDGKPRLVTALKVTLDEEQNWAVPIPPLNLSVRDGNTGESPSYVVDFRRVIKPKGYRNILRYLRREANLRNTVLYASPEGYPVVSDFDDRFILERQARVLLILKATLLISPYSEHQPFVVSAISAFIKIASRISASRSAQPEA